ncbi:MAG: SGNH/GDSL hydrolase family protein [Christensenellaceae bacterium]|nr:SGNH/GDSL hydrolase family protein [Christensenellaceae bacterium]
MRKKTILCFGDSNTYGARPDGQGRYENRWPVVMQKLLGDEFKIIEEGLCGRTASIEDNFDPYLCGYKTIHMAINTHNPVDMVIIMLGTNDIKRRFNLSITDVSRGVEECINKIKGIYYFNNQALPKILVIAPAPINEGIYNCEFASMFNFYEGIQKSKDIIQMLKEVSKAQKCEFLDASQYIRASKIDGIHLDEEAHEVLGNTVAHKVKELF